MKAIINTKIVLIESLIWDGAILFDGNKIIDFGEKDCVNIPNALN